MIVIGLTGNIGSGKSLAAEFLRQCGAAVIDADSLGHQVLEPGGAAYADVVAAFGREFLRPDGSIDRRRLGAHVFADPQRLQQLNALTHPAIDAAVRRQLDEFRRRGEGVAVIESALLFQTALQELTDEDWLIVAPREKLLRRAAKRDRCDPQQIEKRLANQVPGDELRVYADRVIENDGTQAELQEKISRLYRTLL